MQTFDYIFTVPAPLAAVSAFHHDTSILKLLTPPPMFVQIHDFEPLAEGSVANFTIWAGPIPLRWQAVHSNISENGFTDTQNQGPLQFWQHTHRFRPLSPTLTEVHEHIEYAHHAGRRGLLTRLLFSRPGLYGLFTARKLLTRRHLARGQWADQVA